MSESSKTWVPLKKELDKQGWVYDRIETNSAGVPDLVVYVPNARRDIWIELKYCDLPDPRGNVEIGLRREQFIWMRNSFASGRIVYLLARIGDVFYIWNDAESWEMAKKNQNLWTMINRALIKTCHVNDLIQFLTLPIPH